MPDQPEKDGAETPGTGSNEMEAPLEFLEGISGETSPQFLDRVNLKIHRRVVASHFLSLFWDIPRIVLPEIWSLISSVGSDKKG